MATTARGLGWHPFPGPAAINSQTYDDRPGCLYHGFCNRGGCHVNAKNSTAVSTIPKAVATGRLGVVTQAIVTSVAVDEGSGRVRGVVYLKGGEEYFQPADVVLLAGYTYENVRLLLLSKSKPFPNGLANNGGQVGRHYFSHHTGATLTALFPFDLNNWYGLPAQGVAVDNWADDNFDHAGLDFIGGGNLWVYSDRRPIVGRDHEHVRPSRRPGARRGRRSSRRTPTAGTSPICRRPRCPTRTTCSTSTPSVKDALGFPVIRITADNKDNEKKIGAFIQDKMAQWFMAAGAKTVERGPPGTMGPSTHAYGGTRMGDNRETNVVNRFGFAHEVPNLGILGASVMGTSGAHNPTLTAQALAWRTAEHLQRNWSTIAN